MATHSGSVHGSISRRSADVSTVRFQRRYRGYFRLWVALIAGTVADLSAAVRAHVRRPTLTTAPRDGAHGRPPQEYDVPSLRSEQGMLLTLLAIVVLGVIGVFVVSA